MTDSAEFGKLQQSVAYIKVKVPKQLSDPSIAIICGSGLGGLVDSIHQTILHEIPFQDIPGFSVSTVEGHAGKIVFGLIGSSKVLAVFMVGRLHFYEGHSIQDVTFPIRVLKLLGVQAIIVTNAAGSLNSHFRVGDIVVLNDHINLAGLAGIHPLRGPNVNELGPRFPAMSDAYDLELRQIAHRAWRTISTVQRDRRLHEGIYAFVGGPSYETRAECRMLRSLGADLVGMSTVPEIIVARHCGIRVLAFSLVTNKAVLDPGPRGDDVDVESGDLSKGKANHEEVLEAGRAAAKDMQSLVTRIAENWLFASKQA